MYEDLYVELLCLSFIKYKVKGYFDKDTMYVPNICYL